MKAFIERCDKNVRMQKNMFLDVYVDKNNYREFVDTLKTHGFAEWNTCDPKEIFLSVQEWYDSPYHKQIRLDKISTPHFRFAKEKYAGNYTFNAYAIEKDPRRELNDYMKLRVMDKDFEAVTLYQDDELWMLDAPSEAFTNDPFAKKAHGKVITFGLGIGYFVFMACLNPKVKEIVVVEKNKDVIDMFQKEILPQFPSHPPIAILHADAFAYWRKENLASFDYIYADIWQSNEGLFMIEQLLEQYLPPFDACDFWIEDTCFETVWYLIYLYFKQTILQKPCSITREYRSIFRKIKRYFDALDITVDNPEVLKEMMYDTKIIRSVLSDRHV